MIYSKLIRPILFRTDPETIHHRVIHLLGFVSRRKLLNNLVKHFCFVVDPRLKVDLGRLNLQNPVGLAAGFDKYIEAPLAYPMLGFGWAELGSVTYSEQPGNPLPRLWRIPKDKGLIVYYGLSNDGAEKTAARLSKLNQHPVPFGISIASTTGVPIERMADDYLKSFKKLHQYADYVTLNVSCPNVATCEAVAQVSFITELIKKIMAAVKEEKINKDVFIKIRPDMGEQDLNKVIDTCVAEGVTGIIATNLSKDRSYLKPKSSAEELNHPGGISGKLVQDKSEQVIRHIYRRAGGKLKIIGVGGIFSAEDAYRKIKCGANAVQLITGFIYGGPLTIRNINKGILKLLEADGYQSIAEAVGKEV